METSNMKNMVVLRNLPSNIVDEAIIILKSNKKVKKLELVEKNKQSNSQSGEHKNKEYIVREAEMLVNSYIGKIENTKVRDSKNNILKEKYNRLKKYSFIATVILFISLIINFI